MKIQNLLSGLFLAALMSLGITGTAKAQEGPYTCNEGNNPPPYSQMPLTSGIYIVGDGIHETCTLGDLSADGSIGINAGNVTAGNITSGAGLLLIGSGYMTLGNVEGSGDSFIGSSGDVTINGTVTSHGGPWSISGGTVTITGDIAGTDSTWMIGADGTLSLQGFDNTNGDITILANQTLNGSDPFTIGTSSSNGVAHVHNNGDFGHFIYISNGDGTGGISYSGTNSLQVNANSGPTGLIVLDGRANGNITLTGSLSVDGASGESSGGLYLFTPQIIANGATLSANAPGQQVGLINLITNLITDNSGLTINMNGNGGAPDYLNLSIMPVGSLTVSAPAGPGYPITWGDYSSSANPLTITGSGAFAITANGNNNAFNIYGYPLSIKPASTTFTQQGSGNSVVVASTDADGNFTTVTLGGTIAIHENTTGSGQSVNKLEIDATELATLTGHVLLDTSGTAGGDGSDMTLSFDSGSLALGETGNNIELKADGSSTGGKGGMITAGFGGDLEITIDGGVSASATGGDGDGGTIDITGNQITLADELDANGQGAGSGGNITLTVTGELPLDLTGDQKINAKGGSTGNGGTVVIPNVGDFAVDTAINVNPNDLPASPGIASRVAKSQSRKILPLAVAFSADSSPAGKKVLNGVTCQQYLITGGANSWPTRFWNCAHPGAITSTDEIPATWIASSSTLSSTLLATIFPIDPTGGDDSPTKLYVFSTPDDFNKFFNVTGAHTGDFGITHGHLDSSNNWAFDIAIFEPTGLTQSTMLQTTAHELGHALDFWSNPNVDGSLGYWSSNISSYVGFDKTRLNADLGSGSGPDQGAGTVPCSTNNTAPFDGQPGFANSVVNSATGLAICNETTGVLNSGSGSTNVAIATNASPGILGSGNQEIFAEVFSWAVYTSTLTNPQYNSYYQKTFDGLLANGYFGCALAWGQYAATAGSGSPSLPSYCH